jgi:hypothetical protein
MSLNDDSHQSNPDTLIDKKGERLPFWKESVVSLSGREIIRIRSSLFYCLGLLSIAVGFLLFINNISGGMFFSIHWFVFFLEVKIVLQVSYQRLFLMPFLNISLMLIWRRRGKGGDSQTNSTALRFKSSLTVM